MTAAASRRHRAKKSLDPEWLKSRAEEQALRRSEETEGEREVRLAKLRASSARFYKANRESVLSQRMHKTYGITGEQARELLAEQGDVCPCCGTALEVFGNGVVDHCHATGSVRGILCQACNKGLGFFADSPTNLRAAAAYLEKA